MHRAWVTDGDTLRCSSGISVKCSLPRYMLSIVVTPPPSGCHALLLAAQMRMPRIGLRSCRTLYISLYGHVYLSHASRFYLSSRNSNFTLYPRVRTSPIEQTLRKEIGPRKVVMESTSLPGPFKRLIVACDGKHPPLQLPANRMMIPSY